MEQKLAPEVHEATEEAAEVPAEETHAEPTYPELIAALGKYYDDMSRLIRITIPPLTEERRRDLTKVSKKYTEDTKVALRNIRRDANDALKKLEKEKEISADDLKKAMDDVQKLTDAYVKKADLKAQAKEKEIMEI